MRVEELKYESSFLKPRESEDIPHHDSSIIKQTGMSYVLLDNIHYPDANIRVTTRYIRNVPDKAPAYVELHTHDVDQIFIFLSDPGNHDALKIEVVLDDEVYNVEAPVTVFIPKNIPHTQRVLSGTGRLVTILMKGVYP